MSSTGSWDVIVVGAGHNGLAAAALLAKRGLRVLCLEKNGYVGGMAGTREILSGCRNDVGAACSSRWRRASRKSSSTRATGSRRSSSRSWR